MAFNFFKKKSQDNIAPNSNILHGEGELGVQHLRNYRYFSNNTIDLPREQLQSIFSGASPFGRRVVMSVVDDALMYWREFKHPDENVVHIIQEAEEKQKVKKIIREAMINARLYGGSFIIPITKKTDEHPQNPLNYDTIEQDSIIQYRILDRYRVHKIQLHTQNPLNEYYMKPARIFLQGGKEIHISRMIKADAKYLPDFMFMKNGFWHHSVLNEVYEILSNIERLNDYLIAGARKTTYDIVKISRFKELGASEEGQQILDNAINYMSKKQSMYNVTFIDSEDNYQQFNTNVSSIIEAINFQIKVLSGITGIPMTKFMGEQQKGMNSSGNAHNDEIMYTNQVKQFQENELRYVLSEFDKFFLRDIFGGKEYERIRKELIWDFVKPKFEDEETEAKIRAMDIESIIKLKNSGLINDNELREELIHKKCMESL